MRTLTKISLLIFHLLMAKAAIAQNIYSSEHWKSRDKWQNVPAIFEAMGIQKGDAVADIGCHEGYMTFKFAKQVGTSGKVYAVDVNRSRISTLKSMLKEQQINHVETIVGDYDNPKLPANSLDYVFIMDTYHEMDDYMDILGHIKKALKPGGKIVIMEPIAKERRGWSRSKQEAKHEIDMKYVIDDLKKAGYKILRQEDPFIDRTKKKKDVLWLLIAEVSE